MYKNYLYIDIHIYEFQKRDITGQVLNENMLCTSSVTSFIEMTYLNSVEKVRP